MTKYFHDLTKIMSPKSRFCSWNYTNFNFGWGFAQDPTDSQRSPRPPIRLVRLFGLDTGWCLQ